MNKKSKIILFIIITITLIALWAAYLQLTFRLIGTSPKIKGYIPSSTPTLILHFNKTPVLSQKDINSIIKNNSVLSTMTINNKTLTLKLKPLDDGHNYAINMGTIKSDRGQTIKNLVLEFKAKYIKLGDLSEEEISQQTQDVDPLSLGTALPHETEFYYIDYFNCNLQKKCISISMNFSVPESYYTNNIFLSDVRKYRNEAVKYLKNNNIDVNNHTLVFSEPVLLNETPRGVYISDEEYTGDGTPPEER